MPGPQSQVADLILQLMMRGKSGGLPMQASPELTQYIAHAQGGTLPPQMHGAQPAPISPGPGSAMAELRNPDFLENTSPEYLGGQMDDALAENKRLLDQLRAMGVDPEQALRTSGATPPFARPIDPMDMMTDRPPAGIFRHAGGDGTEDQLFIWYMNEKGQRVRLDGPFTNDIEAARALREMRQSGLDPNAQVEIAPDFDPRP